MNPTILTGIYVSHANLSDYIVKNLYDLNLVLLALLHKDISNNVMADGNTLPFR